mgnify:CR=1 FL=1|jgi:hypothetical protein
MKVHLVELFAQFTATFLTFFQRVITDFLQDFYELLALFALIFIYRHWFLQTIESIAYFGFPLHYSPACGKN